MRDLRDDDPPPSDLDAAHLAHAVEAPLARASVLCAAAGVIVGILFLPQVLAVALGGLSLARREPGGQRKAVGGIVAGVVLTALWAVALGLLVKWWAGR